MSPALQLRESLAVLRRQWQQRVLLESSVWIALAIILAIVAGLGIYRSMGSTDTSIVVVRTFGYLLILATIVRFLIVPLRQRASDERFALYVEERAPQLRQALLSAMHELQIPEEKQLSPSLTALENAPRLIPDAAVAMLACARIGAVHSVVFGGFSAEAVSDRMNDAEAKVIVTADGACR